MMKNNKEPLNILHWTKSPLCTGTAFANRRKTLELIRTPCCIATTYRQQRQIKNNGPYLNFINIMLSSTEMAHVLQKNREKNILITMCLCCSCDDDICDQEPKVQQQTW